MKVSYIPDGVPGKRKKSRAVSWLAQAGFEDIVMDLRQYCSPYELEHREQTIERMDEYPDGCFASVYPERIEKFAERFLEQCQELQLKTTVGIVPSLPWESERTDLESLICDLTRRSLIVCRKAQCHYMVLNPLVKSMDMKEEREKNIEFYLSFQDCISENEKIVVPNFYRTYNGRLMRGSFSDPYELRSLVDELNSRVGSERYGLYIDIGICNLLGQNPYEFLCLLKDRVKAVLIRENNGITDNALLPFTAVNQRKSRMDWQGVILGLRNIDFDGSLVFDFRGTSEACSHLLRPDLDLYFKKLTDYFAWQVSMERVIKQHSKRVLFGAGNMCRNYMKCYGDDYPPFFTCDNNEKLWGTQFCGLTVESPEKLRTLSEDTAIYICNIYYREIEKQLRDMGLKNPIEFFNDEYMPTVYFDRVEISKDVGGKR